MGGTLPIHKQRILEEAEAAAATRGAVGALLRREGLLTTWWRERANGIPRGFDPTVTRAQVEVEDDADVRLGYHVLLKANHYDTFFAADALSAVSEARMQQPDLIILDLGLPAGDGFVVLERFRANMYLS